MKKKGNKILEALELGQKLRVLMSELALIYRKRIKEPSFNSKGELKIKENILITAKAINTLGYCPETIYKIVKNKPIEYFRGESNERRVARITINTIARLSKFPKAKGGRVGLYGLGHGLKVWR